MGRLDGKVALISGAARGQGACHARMMAQEGASVVLGDIVDDEGQQVARTLRRYGDEQQRDRPQLGDEAQREVVRVNKLASCYIRPLVYLGYGEMGLNPLPCPVTVAIAVWLLPTSTATQNETFDGEVGQLVIEVTGSVDLVAGEGLERLRAALADRLRQARQTLLPFRDRIRAISRAVSASRDASASTNRNRACPSR